jgi:hypothetical protein
LTTIIIALGIGPRVVYLLLKQRGAMSARARERVAAR